MPHDDSHPDSAPFEKPAPGHEGSEEPSREVRIDKDTVKDLPSIRRTDEARRREKVLWLTLAALVGFIFLGTLLSGPPVPSVDQTTADTGGLELRFQARYVLGVDHTLGAFVAAMTDQNLEGQLLDPLRQMADTPGARLSIVPVIAEVAGVEEARAELDAIAATASPAAATATDLALLQRLYADPPATLDPEEREAFVERRGWFARLALVYGVSDDDPERREILHQATRTALFLIVLAAAVLGGAGVGLILLLVGITLLRKGKLRFLYRPQRGALTLPRRLPYLETLVVFILATLAISTLAVAILPEITGPVSLIVSMLAGLACFWPLLRGEEGDDVRRAFGWYRGKGMLHELGCGFLGYLAGAPILVFAMLISVGLAQFVDKLPYHPLVDHIGGAGPGQIFLVYFLACVWAPVVEEALFRGGFYHYLRGSLGVLASALLISLIFAVIHPQGILGVPPLVALALILAYLREWRGSLIAPIGVHALHNGLAVTAMFMMLG